jgi:glutaminyl-peptide cyclotransferase
MRHLRLAALAAVATACGAGGMAPPVKEFDGKQALAYAATQVAFGPRVPGKPGHAAMAVWLDSITRAKADTVVVQRWWHKTLTGDSIEMTNYVARFNVAATQRVLYMAHWDTRPRSDNDPKEKNTPIPGANDGASGVAILLGVADALKKAPPKAGVDLLFVDGEDYGFFTPPETDVLIGATWYAQHPVVADRPLFVLLFDMIGQKDVRVKIEENSQIAAPDVVDEVWTTAEQLGYGHIFVREPQGAVTDDHSPFISAGFRAVDLIDFAYAPWHTKDDTMDKLSAQSLEAVGNVAVAVIRRAVR